MPVIDTPIFGSPKGPWIRSFAWTPKFTYDSGWIWLRRCWKRHIHKHQYLDGGRTGGGSGGGSPPRDLTAHSGNTPKSPPSPRLTASHCLSPHLGRTRSESRPSPRKSRPTHPRTRVPCEATCGGRTGECSERFVAFTVCMQIFVDAQGKAGQRPAVS